jgi:hypothetical protein
MLQPRRPVSTSTHSYVRLCIHLSFRLPILIHPPTLPPTHTRPPTHHLLTHPTSPLIYPPPSLKSQWPTKTGTILINKLEHVCRCKQMILQRVSVLSSVTWRFNPLSRGTGLFCFGFISLPAMWNLKNGDMNG